MYRSVCYSVCYTPNNLAENAEAAPLGFVWKCLWPQAKVDPTVELFHKSTYTHTHHTLRENRDALLLLLDGKRNTFQLAAQSKYTTVNTVHASVYVCVVSMCVWKGVMGGL